MPLTQESPRFLDLHGTWYPSGSQKTVAGAGISHLVDAQMPVWWIHRLSSRVYVVTAMWSRARSEVGS